MRAPRAAADRCELSAELLSADFSTTSLSSKRKFERSIEKSNHKNYFKVGILCTHKMKYPIKDSIFLDF